MEHSFGAKHENVLLRPLLFEDLEKLREWRNDTQLSKYLMPINYISSKAQQEWYLKYLEENNCIFFSIKEVTLNSVVGALAIYNMQPNSADIGKIVVGDSRAHGKSIGYIALLMAMKIGIQFMNLKTYTLSCHENNISALKTYLKAGFSRIGEHSFSKGGYEIEMSLDIKTLHSNKIFNGTEISDNYYEL